MTITARFVAGLLGAPVAQAAATKFLSDLSLDQRLSELEGWLRHLDLFNERVRFGRVDREGNWLVVGVEAPHLGRIAFRLVDGWESVADIVVTPPTDLDVIVNMACDDEVIMPQDLLTGNARPEQLWTPPGWSAALIVEHAKPLYAGWAQKDSAVPYFEQLPPAGAGIALKRTGARMRRMLGRVVTDPGALQERLDALALEQPFNGPILLCSTFLPSVFESPTAVKRFFQFYSAAPQGAELIDRKVALHRQRWLKHLEKHRRVDLIDREQLMEYLAAPDYYQMPLLENEIDEQLVLIEELGASPHYELCLTPEAVDLPYEIYGGEVHIRSDRRNKGQGRVGKISGLRLNDPSLVESFQREFWTSFEGIEPKFRDKAFVTNWIRQHLVASRNRGEYDVAFFGPTTSDQGLARLADALEERNVICWRAERDAAHGLSWPQALEHCGSVGVVVVVDSEHMERPWADLRMKALLERIVLSGSAVLIASNRNAVDHPLPAVENTILLSFRDDVFETLTRVLRAVRGRKRFVNDLRSGQPNLFDLS